MNLSLQTQFPLRNTNTGLKLYPRFIIKRLNPIYSITAVMQLEEDFSLQPTGISVIALGTDGHPSCHESSWGRHQTKKHCVTALHCQGFMQTPLAQRIYGFIFFPSWTNAHEDAPTISPKDIPICHRAIVPVCRSGSAYPFRGGKPYQGS